MNIIQDAQTSSLIVSFTVECSKNKMVKEKDWLMSNEKRTFKGILMFIVWYAMATKGAKWARN